MEKYLFLDMDGVLNSRQHILNWYNEHGGYSLENRKLFAKEFKNCTKLVFPDLVNRLNNFLTETEINVILSSSWRLIDEYNTLRKIKTKFKKLGIYTNNFIGVTPDFRRFSNFRDGTRGPRAIEIKDWLETNKISLDSKIIIFDDDYVNEKIICNSGYKNCKLFQTSNLTGISDEDILNAKLFLNVRILYNNI